MTSKPKTTQKKLGRYLLWDFDGTLAYRTGGWTGALIQVLKKSRPELSVAPEKIRPYLQSGFPWHAPENAHPDLKPSEWWEDLYPVFARAFRAAGVPSSDAMPLARKVRAVYLDKKSWQCFADTQDALSALTTLGWKHILLSNHVPELPALLEQLKLTAHFTAIFNSADTGYEKPNHKAYRIALDWIGPNNGVWMVGDSYHADIAGALEISLPAILVRTPDSQAPHFYPSLIELVAKM